MPPQELQKMIEVYKQAFKIHGPTPQALAWRNELSQQVRFQTLLEIVDKPETFNGKTILDVGCGLGDLYKYFKAKKITVTYTGIDIVDDFINYAQKPYPEAKFILGDYQEVKLGKFDYIFASGIFNFQLADNVAFLTKTVKKMFQNSRHGVAFNFLTQYHTQKEKEFYYYNPAEIFQASIEPAKVSGAELRLDYELVHNLNDATIYLIK